MQAFRLWGGSLVLAGALVAGCAGNDGGEWIDPGNPRPGARTFVSADDSQGTASNGREDLDHGAAPGSGGGGGGGGESDRTVEEGDVYRTFGTGKLLNLNAYRGLQVVDISDLAAPAIVGRLEMSGTPVELYTSGDRAYVLMNDWRSYWGGRGEVAVAPYEGGVILSVDLSDPAHPVVIDRELVPGWIYKSRMVKGGGQESLYVVSQEYGEVVDASGGNQWTTTTKVTSFGVASGHLTAAGTLDLGGWIADIAATPQALLVARHDWQGSGGAMVSIVDISDPAGTMIEGDEVQIQGQVSNQFNMDLRGGLLRVVSGRRWSGTSNANHLEIFDAADLQNLVRIDHETFGEDEDLYATLFLDESAFFVTYFRTDPFHAFEITPAGDATEMSEFIVSGWNDFFRATFDERRLVGIGTNDEQGRTMAVSLYDITNLASPDPLVARAEVAADDSWSEASWDHRAFSVLENAVAVAAGPGVVETGLVLLPFSGWDIQSQSYTAGVQVFTFSETTLTRRGVMNHGSPVHRSFQPVAATAANLSQEELSLFDIANPAQPVELSRLDLAPNYTGLIPFGSHAVRIKEPDDWYGWYQGGGQARPTVAQVIPRSGHPDAVTPLASLEVPRGASLYKVGTSLLASVTYNPVDTSSWPYTWETTVQVYDLSDPAHPVERGSLVTTQIERGYSYGYYGYGYMVADCFDCGGYSYGGQAPVHVVGNVLAFVEHQPEKESLGQERICQSTPRNRGTCYGSRLVDGCTYVDGYETCTTRNGQTACSGGFVECVYEEDDGGFTCSPLPADVVPVDSNCWDRDTWRHWNRASVEVVDLSLPDAPQIGQTITTPRGDEAVSVLASGSTLWLSYKQPWSIPGDPKPYVRFFSRPLDLSSPAQPALGAGINLPGQLLAIDGNTLFTRDQVWGQAHIEAAVARLRRSGDIAILEAHRRFPVAMVETIALDGAGHVLVSHSPGYTDWYGYGYGYGQPTDAEQQLTILDASSPQLTQLAQTAVDSWATLKDARAGRALFQVPGGLLVYNLDAPAAPWPQAFFATKGWPSDILVDGRQIVFAAGRHGLYEFDLDESNLPQP